MAEKKTGNSKLKIPMPFEETVSDLLKVKPPDKPKKQAAKPQKKS